MDKPESQQQPDVILNVDDNEAKRYAVSRVLKHGGFQVLEGGTGQEALRLAQERPSLIILDIKLPDMDGFEVCRTLKADPATSAIPVVHLSATFVESAYKVRGLEDGADGYLTYPVEPQELLATVRAMLRLREAEAAARSAANEWDVTFNAITDGICLLDNELRVRRCNQAFEHLLDASGADIYEHPCISVLRKALSLSPDVDMSFIMQPNTKSKVEIECGERTLQFVTDPISSTGGAVLIISDITERRNMEEKLAAAYNKERRIAESLQRSLLITVPDDIFPGLTIASFYEPAWDEASIGGDFYDMVHLREDRIALVVGDASGKGLAAAARTAEVKFALRAFLQEHQSAAPALAHLNNFMCELSEFSRDVNNNIVVISIAIVDTSYGSVEFASAGAEPCRVANSTGEIRTVAASGLPIGAFPDAEYENETMTIERGDLIYMITDGLTEARRGMELLGSDGLEALISKTRREPDLRSMGAGILDGARNFAGGKFQDDACLVIATRS